MLRDASFGRVKGHLSGYVRRGRHSAVRRHSRGRVSRHHLHERGRVGDHGRGGVHGRFNVRRCLLLKRLALASCKAGERQQAAAQ